MQFHISVLFSIDVYYSLSYRLLSQLADTTSLVDLLLSKLSEETSSNNNGLLGKVTLTENLENTGLGAIDDWSLVGVLIGLSGFLRDEGPDLLDVDSGAMISVSSKMEVAHTNLSEVTWMVLVEVNSVMVLTTGLTTTTRMLAVLSNTTVTHTHVSSKVSSLLQT